MTPPLPEPMYRRLSDLQSGIDDWHSPSQMTEYGKACAAAAIKELSGDACSDLTIAYLDGLHTGRKQEQDRILRIVHEQANAYGKAGECMRIGIRAKVRSQPSVKEACEAQVAVFLTQFETKTDWSAA